MWRSWRIPCWRSLRRRLCAALTLVAHLLATLGLPLSAPARTAGEPPFPCQDHPCGCRTAAQCWASCCCFTPAQRLAWACARHIDPPAYAEPPGTRGWRKARRRDRAQPPKAEPTCRQCAPADPITAKPHCPAEVGPAVCCTREAPGTPPGEAVPERPGCHPTPGQPTREAKPASKGAARWGLGIAALRCQGLSTLWATTGAALPPAASPAWSPYLSPVAWLTSPAESPLALPSAPRDPPPRQHAG